jgi:hypothetical protein
MFFVQDPSLEGTTAGRLRVVFDKPTTFVQFGVALSTAGTLKPGCKVKLLDAGNDLIQKVRWMTTRPVGGDTFTEGQFTYNGSRAVKTLSIVFNTQGPTRFAFDNLSYVLPSPSATAGPRSGSGTGGTPW